MLQRENKHDFRMADWRDEREVPWETLGILA